MDPETLFMDSGGDALLKAHDLPGTGMAAYFSATLEPWPKEGADAKRVTRPVPIGTTGIVIADGKSLTIYGGAAAPEGLPQNVKVLRNVHSSKIPALAADLMDSPRPLLFLTVGVSYTRGIAAAALSQDPGSVVVSGHIEMSLDRDRVRLVEDAISLFGVPGYDLKKLAAAYEASMVDPSRPITNQGVDRIMRKTLGLKPPRAGSDVSTEDIVKIRQAWERIDLLPPTEDPSWSVALSRKD